MFGGFTYALTCGTVNLPSIFNSFLIFAAYEIKAQIQGTEGLSVSQVVTSLAALNLLSAPLSNLLYAIPQGWSGLGCFTRVQNFLLEVPRMDQRTFQASQTTTDLASDTAQSGTRLGSWKQPASHSTILVNQGHAAPVTLSSGLTVLLGPVGCGKSTFLRGLLGETNRFQGQVQIGNFELEAAYCAQTPWIFSGSIRENIVSGTEFDADWYATVCHACALDVDFERMSQKDHTAVDGTGMTLSGGQKQRIVGPKVPRSVKKVSLTLSPLEYRPCSIFAEEAGPPGRCDERFGCFNRGDSYQTCARPPSGDGNRHNTSYTLRYAIIMADCVSFHLLV